MAKKKQNAANDNGLKPGQAGLHAVGYSKPPKHAQFKKGTSGNPNGRPKGNKNKPSAIQNFFDQKVSAIKHGKSQRIPLVEALLINAAKRAFAGNDASTKMLLGLYGTAHPQVHDNEVPRTGSSFELAPEEWTAIQKSNLLKGIK